MISSLILQLFVGKKHFYCAVTNHDIQLLDDSMRIVHGIICVLRGTMHPLQTSVIDEWNLLARQMLFHSHTGNGNTKMFCVSFEFGCINICKFGCIKIDHKESATVTMQRMLSSLSSLHALQCRQQVIVWCYKWYLVNLNWTKLDCEATKLLHSPVIMAKYTVSIFYNFSY